jgi:hypothetical protein
MNITSESVDLLPAREALQTVTINWAPKIARVHATNVSAAVNVFTVGSLASSSATQVIMISQ